MFLAVSNMATMIGAVTGAALGAYVALKIWPPIERWLDRRERRR
jgi:hypothetical protein